MATAAVAGNKMEITVPALQQLYGAMWAEDTSEVLSGEGLLRPLATVGDGACAIHAMCGNVNSEGMLFCPNARSLMAQAMDLAYTTWIDSGESGEHFCNVLELVWWELPERAAKTKSTQGTRSLNITGNTFPSLFAPCNSPLCAG